jgi:DNA-binding FadR family transcriptional regulator
MNKPISKHALRRAIEKVQAEGMIDYSEPIGTVVDRIWHEVEKATFNGVRKRPVARTASRVGPLADLPDSELP